ncbi:MAG TPA: branched-chain amino acid ABC transporter substrate-binding protein [Chloroflexota bacterium]|nr:branched-chain amino acid ABC transporter substrate-binding protein [Chloroflexota bacterium]
MKKLLYLGAMITFIGSFSLVGYQKTQAASSQAPLVSVRLCSSAPVGVGGDAHIVQGIWHGVSVATASWRARFKRVGLNLVAPLDLDDAKSDGSAVDPAKEASNARTCLGDRAAMGYVGTLNSSMAQVSEPILNRGGMAMISPSNTNPILTNPLVRSTYEPLYASHRLKYPTYYRVVTTDALQGPVGAIYMKSLGITNFYLVDDQQTYGAGLAQHMAAWATGHLGMSEVGSGHLDTSSTAATATSAAAVARQVVAKKPQAIYCGCDEPYSGPMLAAARRQGFTGYYFGGDAINDVSFGTKYAGGVANLYKTYSTTVGNPAATPKSFLKLEHKYYPGWIPGPYDTFSYDAADIILSAVYKSKLAGTLKGNAFQRRSSILKYIGGGHFNEPGIGPFHFDKNGDTSVRVLSVWNWKGSTWSLLKVFYSKDIPASIRPTP